MNFSFLFNFDEVKKILIIGASVVSPKVIIIFIPYLFMSNELSHFNDFYFTASLLSIFSIFGFDFIIYKTKPQLKFLIVAVLINYLITFFVYLLFNEFKFSINPFYLSIYAISNSLTSILCFYFLFEGRYIFYSTISILSSFFILFSISLIKIFHFDIESTLAFMSLIPMIILLVKYYLSTLTNIVTVKNFYQKGLMAFIINSLLVAIFSLDKFLSLNFFSKDLSNSYIFAWSLIVPVFYFGNIIEKAILSHKNVELYPFSPKVKSLFYISLRGYSTYFLFIIIILYYFPYILPKSINIDNLKFLVPIFIVLYSVYSIFHFPINGILFKQLGDLAQKKVWIFFIIIGITYFFIIYFEYKLNLFTNTYILISNTATAAFTLLFFKGLIIYRFLKINEHR